MSRKLIFILLFPTLFQPPLNYQFVQSRYDPEKINQWVEIGNGKVAYHLYYLGSACDMPIIQDMRASVSNDTLYIFSGIPPHTQHEEIGESEVDVDLILDKSDVPNYKNLIVVR